MLLLVLAAATSTSAAADTSTSAAAGPSTSAIAPAPALKNAERRFAERYLEACPIERNATYGRAMEDVVLGSPRAWGTCLGLAQRALTGGERAALIAGSDATGLDAERSSDGASIAAVGLFGAGALTLFAGGVTALMGGLRGDDKGESLAIGGGLMALSGAVVAAAGFIWGSQRQAEDVVPAERVDAHNRRVAAELGLDPARGVAWARTSTAVAWPALDRARADVAPHLLHPISAFGITPTEWVRSPRGDYDLGGRPVLVHGVQQGDAPRFLTDAQLRILLGPDSLPTASGPSPSVWVGGSLSVLSVVGGLAGMTASAALDDVPAHTTFAFDAMFAGGALLGAMIANYASGPDEGAAATLRAIQAYNDAMVAAALDRASAP